MTNADPILFIDDDPDDHLLFKQLFAEIAPHREVIFLTDGDQALSFLQSTDRHLFMIITEAHMHGMSGLELRREIEKDPQLRKKAIPFIFFTHPIEETTVNQAYELTIQGLFDKQADWETMQSQLDAIVKYWSNCYHPNMYPDN